MTDPVTQLEQTIEARKLLPPRSAALIAVSGGVDSMVLLHLLAQLAPAKKWRLSVAHFNHRLRGRSSDADEKLVRRAARKLSLPCLVGSGDVKAHAAARGLSIEMAARDLRHEYLSRTARQQNISTIVTAHHLDDQVELFFLRLLRGAGPEGLTGMKWKGTSFLDNRIRMVRPLLGQTKTELYTYARKTGIAFREDATNQSVDFLRNRIRRELLPLLSRRYQPGLTKTTARLMDLLSAESEFVEDTAHTWLRKRHPSFSKLPLALQRRVLQMQIFELGHTADFDLIERLRGKPETPVSLGPRFSLSRDKHGTLRLIESGRVQFQNNHRVLKLRGTSGSAGFGGLSLGWRIKSFKNGNAKPPSRRASSECFDAKKVGSKVVLRHWQPGDVFRPIGMVGTVKLQDLFSNLKIPRARRHKLVVATTAQGELFWVEDMRIAEEFKILPTTRHGLEWRWKRILQ